jgi:hypothetical protein
MSIVNAGKFEELLAIPVASLGVLILFAGISKVFYLNEFRNTLVRVPYLSLPISKLASVLIPIAEVLGGAGLLFGQLWGVAIVVTLLALISLAAILARVSGTKIPCVCFTSTSNSHLSLGTAGRNLLLILVALIAQRSSPAIENPIVMAYGIAFLLLACCADASLDFYRLRRLSGRG